MATQPKHFYTVEAYLAQEETALERHEYFRGEIFAMSGGSPAHSIINANTILAIGNQLAGGKCRLFDSNQGIRTASGELYTYPDVVVAYANRQFDGNFLLNPVCIVEVLSPSTEAYDRGRKFELYQQIPSFQEYLLISQDRPSLDRYLRDSVDPTVWHRYSYRELNAVAPVSSISVQLKLSELYQDVVFDQ